MNFDPPHRQAGMQRHVATHSQATLLLIATSVTAGLLALTATVTAQETDSEQAFQQRCGACHSLEPGRNGIGPHLSGIIGRRAGSIGGARYSEAMQNSRIVWDGQSLDTFLAAPRETVSGTRMTVGVSDAAQRAAIIAYLESL